MSSVKFGFLLKMRLYIVLGFLLVVTHAEKRINLDDIERDNLRSESKTKSVTESSINESKYGSKTEVEIPQYRDTSSRYNAPINQPATYNAPEATQNVPSETYAHPTKYDNTEVIYPQKNNVLPEENVQQIQYYTGYQQQPQPQIYEQQQIVYQQPEIIVGNQIQSIQQKAAAEKYIKGPEQETVYIDIPMSQLLSYYPNLVANPTVSLKEGNLHVRPLVQQLAPEATQQISIPVYTPLLNQKLITPVKAAYQTPTTYAQQYIQPLSTAYNTKISKIPVTPAVNLKKHVSSPVPTTAAAYIQPEQTYNTQSKKLQYAQTYLPPSQPAQYVQQQLVYSQPSALYTHAVPVYTDLYNHEPAYVQDNSVLGQVNQYVQLQQHQHQQQEQQQQQLLQLDPVRQQQSPKLLLQQQNHGLSENYIKLIEEPNTHFVPPQLPAQSFKSKVVTHLSPISSGDEESLQVSQQVEHEPTEPRSLLDSYVPSRIIAAQDYARYRERPIKLEGGFLPSKVNFVHSFKKRKTEQ